MIVNSYPYNPSQQQQQRCVGLTSNKSSSNSNQSSQEASSMNRLLNLSSSAISQQNSLYGSSAFDHLQQQQPMLHTDLSHIQFDPMNAAIDCGIDNSMLQSRKLPQQRSSAASQDNSQATNVTTANNDVSLYSPSSSTSLLYHIYDQINLPNDHQQSPASDANGKQQQHANQNKNNNKNTSNNTTTVLNPANLFNSNNSNQQQLHQQQLPLQMQMQMQNHHQHQLSQLAEMQKHQQQQQQQCYSTYQQHPFSTLNPHHQQQQQPTAYLTSNQQQQNLMLDTVMRHQRLHNQTTTTRPPSSSAASSMSGQSIPGYGRHLRQSFIGSNVQQTTNGFATTAPPSKSHNNLASVLHANQTLAHLGHPHLIFGSAATTTTTNRSPMTPSSAKLHGSRSGLAAGCCWPFSGLMSGKQMNQRARSMFHEYRTIVKCSLLLIILASALLSVIKLTMLTPSSNASSHNQMSPYLNSINPSSGSSNIFYPPPYQQQNSKPDLAIGTFGPSLTAVDSVGTEEQAAQAQRQDMLRSRLLTGEFVILSQNFSRTPSQRTIMAEQIVKLMDQVFLSSPDVKQLYSRTEIISIRGIIVNCNIILNESIAYAPQQFGLALVNSLDPSHSLLANQVGYELDKNSIKLNSVPDKDLKSGLVPQGLIPTSLIQQLGIQPTSTSTATLQQQQQPIEAIRAPPAVRPMDDDMIHSSSQDSAADQVVWSEWSEWSSCVDKNGFCDPARLHSRLRRCIAQQTGEKVDPGQCRQRYSMQDQELEVSDCSRSCSAQPLLQILPGETHTQSDEPLLGPHTASPFLVDSRPFKPAPGPSTSASKLDPTKEPVDDESTTSSVVTSSQASAADLQQQQQKQPSIIVLDSTTNDIPPASAATLMPPTVAASEVSCSNCTSDEICLLLMQQKVPFCAKVKDRTDQCGGWCKGQNQLCQPIGSSAYKCIHDSECLPEEWRCHNSQCIPLSAHCDGHSNCYDNSDERDCPIK